MADSPLDKLDSLRASALAALELADSEDKLDAWRVEYLGRNGRLTHILRGMADIASEDRKAVGMAGNATKALLESKLLDRKTAFEEERLEALSEEAIDITLPGRTPAIGRYHPSTMVIREIVAIFKDMGFQTVEGPEVEWDEYNFEKLNIPKDHPARDMFDTFWLDTNRGADGEFTTLLRTHTSPMQARVMEGREPPIRVIVPGKCYRYEATDATHESQFHQIEGLAVDKGITFANLKHTLYEFARRMFGPETKVRFRCDYFPFVEPGVDMSIEWRGAWLEILGAGMVHPNVLRAVGYDPAVYSGFAFGMGPERIAMLKYRINDIRLFLGNDLRFLRQF